MTKYRDFQSAANCVPITCCSPLRLFVTLLCSVILLVSCGKKGALKLPVQKKTEAPHISSIIHREDMIILQWTYPESPEVPIERFIILKSSGSDFDIVAKPAAANRSYTDYDFNEDVQVSYEMVAVTPAGRYSDRSNIVSAVPQRVPPAPGLLALTIVNSSLRISWERAGDDVFYNIYKRTGSETFGLEPINESPLSENSFTDALNLVSPVSYAVRSSTGSSIRNEGTLSSEIKFDPSDLVPLPPRNIRYFASPEGIYLIWDESDEPWVTVYRIYRKMEDGQFRLLGETSIPTFIDREKLLISRDYRISAAGPVTEGNFAEIKSISVSPAQ